MLCLAQCIVLCCAVLCCAAPFCSVLCYAVLYRFVLWCAVPCTLSRCRCHKVCGVVWCGVVYSSIPYSTLPLPNLALIYLTSTLLHFNAHDCLPLPANINHLYLYLLHLLSTYIHVCRGLGITRVVNCTIGVSKIPDFHQDKLLYYTFMVTSSSYLLFTSPFFTSFLFSSFFSLIFLLYPIRSSSLS